MTATIRVAAAGDIPAGEVLRERIERTFSAIGRETDLVLLAGDLTTHGLPEQAAVLADACRSVHIPIVAVSGTTTIPASARRSPTSSSRQDFVLFEI